MSIRRRDFLKLGAGGVAAAAGAIPASGRGVAREAQSGKGMLYDATRCIGCRACQTSCRKRLGFPPSLDEEGLYDQPTELSPRCASIIRLYQSEDGQERSFIRHQCMHCLDPACASACLVKALRKTPEGPVVYDVDKCIGCRYCMIACPFDVPKFEYEKAIPAIRKCPFCFEYISRGQPPRCVAACPTEALIFGDRQELLREAWGRIYAQPDGYVHHVYGEHEVGGTAALYIAGVPFDKLGFPTDLPDTPIPERTRPFLNAVPLVILMWAAFCTGLHWFTQRRQELAAAQAPAGDQRRAGGPGEREETRP